MNHHKLLALILVVFPVSVSGKDQGPPDISIKPVPEALAYIEKEKLKDFKIMAYSHPLPPYFYANADLLGRVRGLAADSIHAILQGTGLPYEFELVPDGRKQQYQKEGKAHLIATVVTEENKDQVTVLGTTSKACIDLPIIVYGDQKNESPVPQDPKSWAGKKFFTFRGWNFGPLENSFKSGSGASTLTRINAQYDKNTFKYNFTVGKELLASKRFDFLLSLGDIYQGDKGLKKATIVTLQGCFVVPKNIKNHDKVLTLLNYSYDSLVKNNILIPDGNNSVKALILKSTFPYYF